MEYSLNLVPSNGKRYSEAGEEEELRLLEKDKEPSIRYGGHSARKFQCKS